MPLGRVAKLSKNARTTLQLTANDHLPGSINAVHLKNRLGDVETNCRDRCMVGSSELWQP